jgi:hypothetical protein
MEGIQFREDMNFKTISDNAYPFEIIKGAIEMPRMDESKLSRLH